MNPSATAAAPRAAHDALDASPRVPTTYLPARSTSAFLGLPTYQCSSYNFLPTTYSFSGGGRRQHFSFKTAVRRRPLPNGALHARSARGGLLWCPQTVISEPTNAESKASISALSSDTPSRRWTLPTVVKLMEFSTEFSIFNAWRRQILPPVPQPGSNQRREKLGELTRLHRSPFGSLRPYIRAGLAVGCLSFNRRPSS